MKPFRVGLYGCGGRTTQIVEKALRSGVAQVTLCHDINPKRAELLAKEYGGKVCPLEELLESKSVDMLLISLFPAAHPGALLGSIGSGKPIYIEKPVAVFMEDIRRLAPLVGKGYVHVGLFYRYIPVFRMLASLVESGKIGELVGINFNWLCNSFEPGKGMEENPNWRVRPETGGELTQHYCHAFEWFRQLGGDFESILAMSSKVHDNKSCVEDIWDLIIKQRNGCQISFHSSERNPKYTVSGYLEGTNGSLEWEWNQPSTITYFQGLHQRSAGEAIHVPDEAPDALEEFIARFKSGAPPAVSLEDGLWSVLPPVYARESVRTGTLQSFPTSLQQRQEMGSGHLAAPTTAADRPSIF